MTAMPGELARRQPAEIVRRKQPAAVTVHVPPAPAAPVRKQRSAGGRASLFLLKLIAILLLTAGFAGYLLASMQTV